MKKRPLTILAMTALATLLLTACEQYATYTPSAADLTALAEQYHGEDKEMIQGTAVSRYLTAEAARVQAEHAQAQVALAQATQQAAEAAEAHQIVMLTAEAQATLDVLNVRGTTEAMNAQATAQAAALEATRQAEALALQATAQAQAVQATATERAWRATATQQAIDRHTTATAEAHNRAAMATAQHKADVATATRQAWEARTTATAESAHATAAAFAATATRAAEQREIVLGYGRDYGIPLILLVIAAGIGALIVYGVRELKKRPVVLERNPLGDADPMAFPDRDGGYTLVDIDRQPGPVLQVASDGKVTAPLLRSADQEERTTARDQELDARTRPRIGGGHRPQPQPLLAPLAPPPAPGLRSIRILRRLEQANRAGFIPASLTEALAADWEEVSDGDGP